MSAVLEGCPTSVVDAPLGSDEAEALASALGAMADPARLRLISFIAAQPGQVACVCDLTAPVGLSQPTVSHHLKVLHDVGILDREQRGRWVHYSVRIEALDLLASVLSTGGS
jgi:ArsR family transcriptional regulator, arsenate/arsenite/antimonite-responsive transcriptional repressor